MGYGHFYRSLRSARQKGLRRLARDGDPEPIYLEETDTSFAIEWKGHYRIEGPAFVYADRDTGRVTTIDILGYPTQAIAHAG